MRDSCVTQLADGEFAPRQVLPGYRRVPVRYIRRAKRHACVKTVLALIYTLEYQASQGGLECAAHHESLIGTPLQRSAGPEVSGKYAQSTAARAFVIGDRRDGRFHRAHVANPESHTASNEYSTVQGQHIGHVSFGLSGDVTDIPAELRLWW